MMSVLVVGLFDLLHGLAGALIRRRQVSILHGHGKRQEEKHECNQDYADKYFHKCEPSRLQRRSIDWQCVSFIKQQNNPESSGCGRNPDKNLIIWDIFGI